MSITTNIPKKPVGGDGVGKRTLFIDCDDTLYRNENWEVAKLITRNIDDYVTQKLGLPSGKAYELYKKHGTCLRGLQQEEIKFDLDDFLKTVHEIPKIEEDPDLKKMLNRITVDKWVFTASIKEHATNCIEHLGVEKCFENPIIDVRAAKFHTKHSIECYQHAMEIAKNGDPSLCYIVDDSWSNIKTAKKIGWNTALIGLKSRDGKDALKYMSDFADHIIADVKELPKIWPELFEREQKSSPNGARRRKSSKGKRRKAD
eukprot:jgi/Bigna1/53754/estExt_Genewise1Plus.C_230179